MNFKKYLNSFDGMAKLNEKKVTVKQIELERSKIYNDFKKFKPLINKASKKDFSLALELIKPQNYLKDVSSMPGISESNETNIKKYAKTVNKLITITEKEIYIEYGGENQEKKIKGDLENVSKAIGLFLTSGIDANINESIVDDVIFGTLGAYAPIGGEIEARQDKKRKKELKRLEKERKDKEWEKINYNDQISKLARQKTKEKNPDKYKEKMSDYKFFKGIASKALFGVLPLVGLLGVTLIDLLIGGNIISSFPNIISNAIIGTGVISAILVKLFGDAAKKAKGEISKITEDNHLNENISLSNIQKIKLKFQKDVEKTLFKEIYNRRLKIINQDIQKYKNKGL